MNGTFVSLRLGELGVVLSLHNTVDPSPEEWAEFIAISTAVYKDIASDVTRFRNLVISDGAAPNAAQRRQMADMVNGKPNRLGVITNALDNPIKRGVATAISWLNSTFMASPPQDWRKVFTHVGLEAHVPEILAKFEELQPRIEGKVTTLAEVRRLFSQSGR